MATINVTVGVANCFIVLYDHTLDTSTQVLTDGSGNYSFTNLDLGEYSVYNTGIDTTGQNPPTECGFPEDYTGTTYPRRLDFNVTGSTQTFTARFNYDKPVPWTVLNGGSPPPYGLTTGGGVNLATGALQSIPTIGNNGMGYNIIDNMIYGRSASNRTDGTGNTVTLNPTQGSLGNVNIGDCNALGHLVLPANVGGFTQVASYDCNPYSTTYLRPISILPPYEELTSSPYRTTITPGRTVGADWSYMPALNAMINVASNVVQVVSLDTTVSYTLPIEGIVQNTTGISFSDAKNAYTPTGSRIYKLEVTPTIARGSYLSNSSMSTVGDGARAFNMPVFYSSGDLTKTVDKDLGVDGDTLIYTVTIANVGIADGLDDYFVDTLPSQVEFIPDSLFLDGVQQVGTTPNRVYLGSLPIGSLRTITFSATINDTIPNDVIPNTAYLETTYYDDATEEIYTSTYNSNEVQTTVVAPYLEIFKSVDKNIAQLNDEILYTIVITNTTTIPATDVTLFDTTPLGSVFVIDSLNVDGTTIASEDLTPPTGYNLGTFTDFMVSTITFKTTVASVPANNLIENIAGITYVYTHNPSTTLPISTFSNLVMTTIAYANLDGMTKTVDKSFETVGGTLTYTITIPNTGNIPATDIVLVDTLPSGTTYVVDTLYVNNVLQPNTFPTIPLGTIQPNEITTVTFQVTIG